MTTAGTCCASVAQAPRFPGLPRAILGGAVVRYVAAVAVRGPTGWILRAQINLTAACPDKNNALPLRLVLDTSIWALSIQ